MQNNSDFEEILLAFNAASVKYLVISAYALAAYARPRATGDIDLWVESNADNARRIYDALMSFGAPLDSVTKTTFAESDIVFQIGVAPIRIDILSGIDGITFAEAWPNRTPSKIGSVPVHIIGRSDLKRNKAASARPQDLADIERLEADTSS
jgi:hypothetical protein